MSPHFIHMHGILLMQRQHQHRGPRPGLGGWELKHALAKAYAIGVHPGAAVAAAGFNGLFATTLCQRQPKLQMQW